jgi:hypothetical protein
MINLAGNKECDKHIREELYLAGVETIPAESQGEVPYSIEGRLGNWQFRRAWYYWIVSTELRQDGLTVEQAYRLHETPNPVCEHDILGFTVRAGGHAGGVLPDSYVAQPVYNEELDTKLMALGFEKEYSEFLKEEHIHITVGEIADLCKSGRLDVERYVDCYHIDTQVGLTEFVKFVKNL